jgi:uncharacterized protein (TIGR03663 family)
MSRWLTWGLLAVAAGALALRLAQLDQRPMHTDESVHLRKFQLLWETGSYRYDPAEYHGPSLYYLTWPAVWLSGAKDFAQTREATFRIVPVAFGVGLILLLLLMADGLGRLAALVAGVLTAVSPAMVFYNRYYIHETMLVFFTMLFMGATWRYTRTRHLGWLLLAALSLGLMHASKETFVIALGSATLALMLALAWSRVTENRPLNLKRLWNVSHWTIAGLAGLAVSVLLFSAFFTNWQGPLDSIRTYLPWLSRASGKTAHVHPWYYYLDLLTYTHRGKGPVWSEGLILILGALGVITGLARKGLGDAHPVWVSFLAFYALAMTAAYSLIPYKTPWCLLGFLHGLILLAGVGAACLIRLSVRRSLQLVVVALLVAGTSNLTWQAYAASYFYCADQRNPYVYAHTAEDLLQLARKVESISKSHPAGPAMVVQVMAVNKDYWPLPWYLRRLKHVGWWGEVPEDPNAPVVIASPAFDAALRQKLGQTHMMTGYFGHRPGVFLELFVQSDLWNSYVQSGPRDENF